ncbi:MAG: mannose-1-phosphate guanylyltransferase [Thermoplasmatota archaeon]
MKAVVLAGGSGERFWPLSTDRTPKQFLRLFDDKTLLRQTYERVGERFADEDILIITSKDHKALTAKELPELPENNIHGEPRRRNTAPACMLGALLSDKDEMDLVLPADHMMPDHDAFWNIFDKAMNAARMFGGLFTFGISPTRPETGYGYIERGKELAPDIYSVSRFKEKPDQATAKVYLESSDLFWNSGMFLWKAGDLIDEMEKCSPDIHGPMADLDPGDPSRMDRTYDKIPSRSIDYAVMERSDAVRMVMGDLSWSDVGSWDSVRELEGTSKDGGDLSLVMSRGVFLRSDIDRPVAVIGLEDITIVDSPEGLLVCSKGSAQHVREAAKRFRKGTKGP